jgi:branched-chain amino acid transport system substrate-binding protein
MSSAPIHRLFAALTLVAAAASGCGSSKPEGRVAGRVLTIYASAPLQGVTKALGRDVVEGERLALGQSGGRVGAYSVRLRVLDNTRAPAERWSPDAVALNARRAVHDPTTIAYLGELETAGSAVSLPILSRKGILQVSPTDTFAGPTEPEGSVPGEPAKYYPTDQRTFGRIVPDDDLQARELAVWMREEGVTRLLVAHDESLYGASLGAEVAREAARRGIRLAPALTIDPDALAVDPTGTATKARAAKPDAVLYTGVGVRSAAQAFRVLHSALPATPLYGPAATALPGVIRRLGPAQRMARLMALAPLERHAAASFARAYQRRYHHSSSVEAAYGYEAMRIVLDGLRAAGSRADLRREAVVRLFTSRRAISPLGSYSMRANGASTLSGYARYRVRRDRLERLQR